MRKVLNFFASVFAIATLCIAGYGSLEVIKRTEFNITDLTFLMFLCFVLTNIFSMGREDKK